jgi:REP element-mobilizing transposase RayT
MVERLKKVGNHSPEINVQKIDHVHALVSISPKISVSKDIGIIKADTRC